MKHVIPAKMKRVLGYNQGEFPSRKELHEEYYN